MNEEEIKFTRDAEMIIDYDNQKSLITTLDFSYDESRENPSRDRVIERIYDKDGVFEEARYTRRGNPRIFNEFASKFSQIEEDRADHRSSDEKAYDIFKELIEKDPKRAYELFIREPEMVDFIKPVYFLRYYTQIDRVGPKEAERFRSEIQDILNKKLSELQELLKANKLFDLYIKEKLGRKKK